jgi:hypothetical protein
MKERQKTQAEELHHQAIELFKGVQSLKDTDEGKTINMNMVKVLESLHTIMIKQIKDE